MAFASDALPARHRRESYDGLEIASDPIGRTDERDFVVGVGPSPRALARLTLRRRVRSVLDLGTGPGIHALLAARHAERVIGVDVNPRALAYAEYNTALNTIDNVEWRLGSWLEPVGDERFDLILANPPYVISPENTFAYRDSGEPGDALVRRLLAQISVHVEEGGYAQILCNWIPRGDNWRAPLEEAIADSGCDAVLLMYERTDPEQYARNWNRSAADHDHRQFERTVRTWLDYYREQAIESIAFGMVVLRRRAGGRNWVRAFKVPAGPTERAGEHLERLFTGWDWVRAGGEGGASRPEDGARLVRRFDLSDQSERISFEVRPNIGFAVRVDEEVAEALYRDRPLSPDQTQRLVGLGMLLTPDGNEEKIEAGPSRNDEEGA